MRVLQALRQCIRGLLCWVFITVVFILLGLLATARADVFYKTYREAEEIASKGGPSLPEQAMDMTAGVAHSVTVDLSTAAGKPLGHGVLMELARLWDGKTPGSLDVIFVVAPQSVLGSTTAVTVNCRIYSYHVDPLLVRLNRDGDDRTLYIGEGAAAGLVAIRLPPSFRETGYWFNHFIKKGGSFLSIEPGMVVRYPRRKPGTYPGEAPMTKDFPKAKLQRSGDGDKAVWTLDTALPESEAGIPIFCVGTQLNTGTVGGQVWLHTFETEVGGIVDKPVSPKEPARVIPQSAIAALGKQIFDSFGMQLLE